MTFSCVYCGGEGETFVNMHWASRPGEWRYLRCQDCDGTGVITQVQHAAYTAGRLRRDRRVATGLTQHEMAQRIGVSLVDYSQMEHGRRPWPEGGETAFDAALAELSVRRSLRTLNDVLEERAKREGA